MRAILKLKSEGPSTSTLILNQFKCDMWQDFYIRLSKTGVNQITAQAYQYEGDAVAGNDHYLAQGTGSIGDRVTITLSAIPSPPFDFGSMQAIVTSEGSPVYVVYAHTGAPATRVLKQMIDIVQTYVAPNEVLANIKRIVPGAQIEEPAFPCIGIEIREGFGVGSRGSFSLTLQCSMWVYTNLTIGGYSDALSLGEQLMGIAIDEQRTWGGMVNNTKPLAAVNAVPMVGRENDSETYLWAAEVALAIGIPDILASQGPNYPEYEGGKYGVAYR